MKKIARPGVITMCNAGLKKPCTTSTLAAAAAAAVGGVPSPEKRLLSRAVCCSFSAFTCCV
jgi:hypothetical protein